MVRKAVGGGATQAGQLTGDELSSTLSDALGAEPQKPSEVLAAVEQIMQPSQNELFFSRVPVLVEGPEDVAFLSTAFHLLGYWQDFRRLGCHFVACGGKTNMSRPLAIAKGLGMPTFAVWDGDSHHPNQETSHRRDNGCLLKLCGQEAEDPWPAETIWGDCMVMWKEDLSRQVKKDAQETTWSYALSNARAEYGLMNHVSEKNGLLISGTLEQLYRSEGRVPACLETAVSNILSFAEQHFA